MVKINPTPRETAFADIPRITGVRNSYTRIACSTPTVSSDSIMCLKSWRWTGLYVNFQFLINTEILNVKTKLDTIW
jgi:hypothetical protein